MRWGYYRTASTLRFTKAVSRKQREGQSHRRGRPEQNHAMENTENWALRTKECR